MTEKITREKLGSGNGKSKKIRVTMIIPYELDRNVEAFSVQEGLRKTEVVTAALNEFLRKRAFQPDRAPKISVSY